MANIVGLNKQVKKGGTMNKRELKAIMAQKGITVTSIAGCLNVNVCSVYDVLHGRRRSKQKIEPALEIAIGISIKEIQSAWKEESSMENPVYDNIRASLGLPA